MKCFNDLKVGDKVYTVVTSDDLVWWDVREHEIKSREYVYEPPHEVRRWVGGGCAYPAEYESVTVFADEYQFTLLEKSPEPDRKLTVQKCDMELSSVKSNDFSYLPLVYYANKEDAVAEVKKCYEQWLTKERNRCDMVENNYWQFIKENE